MSLMEVLNLNDRGSERKSFLEITTGVVHRLATCLINILLRNTGIGRLTNVFTPVFTLGLVCHCLLAQNNSRWKKMFMIML